MDEIELTKAEAIKQAKQDRIDDLKQKSDLNKANYAKIAAEPAFLDLLQHARNLRELSLVIAEDGAGANNKGEDVILTDSQRIHQLGQAAGIKKLLSYIDRQVKGIPATPDQG